MANGTGTVTEDTTKEKKAKKVTQGSLETEDSKERIPDLDHLTKVTYFLSFSLPYSEDTNPMFSDIKDRTVVGETETETERERER